MGTTEPASPPLSSTSPTTAAATMPVGPSVAGLAPPGEAALRLEEVTPPASGTRKARVLYDYEAADSSELALLADEVGLVPRGWQTPASGGADARVSWGPDSPVPMLSCPGWAVTTPLPSSSAHHRLQPARHGPRLAHRRARQQEGQGPGHLLGTAQLSRPPPGPCPAWPGRERTGGSPATCLLVTQLLRVGRLAPFCPCPPVVQL